MPAAQRWASGMTQRVSPGLGGRLLSLRGCRPTPGPRQTQLP